MTRSLPIDDVHLDRRALLQQPLSCRGRLSIGSEADLHLSAQDRFADDRCDNQLAIRAEFDPAPDVLRGELAKRLGVRDRNRQDRSSVFAAESDAANAELQRGRPSLRGEEQADKADQRADPSRHGLLPPSGTRVSRCARRDGHS
jgi:hypothetical protein